MIGVNKKKVIIEHNYEFYDVLGYLGLSKKQFEDILTTLNVPCYNDNGKVVYYLHVSKGNDGVVLWNIRCSGKMNIQVVKYNYSFKNILRLNVGDSYIDYRVDFNSSKQPASVELLKICEKHVDDLENIFNINYQNHLRLLGLSTIVLSNRDKKVTISFYDLFAVKLFNEDISLSQIVSSLKKMLLDLCVENNLSIFGILRNVCSNICSVNYIKYINIIDKVSGREECFSYGKDDVGSIRFDNGLLTFNVAPYGRITKVMDFRLDYGEFSLNILIHNTDINFCMHNYTLVCYEELYNYLYNLKWPVSLEVLCKTLSNFLSNYNSGFNIYVDIVNNERNIKEQVKIFDGECTYLHLEENKEQITWDKEEGFVYTVGEADNVVSISVMQNGKVIYHGPINVGALSSKVMNPLELISIDPLMQYQEKMRNVEELTRRLFSK